jgi:hypothetical protein
MPGARADTLLAMTYFMKRFTLERAWGGLSDDELFWEPAPGAWGIRRRSECTTPHPFPTSDPDWVADYDGSRVQSIDLVTSVEPMTTIGWVFWHCGSMPGRLAELDFLGGSHTAASGWTSPYLTPHPAFVTADDAVSTMRDGWARLVERLGAASDEDLTRPTEWWSFGQARPPTTGVHILGSVLNEISHHAAQIGALRDVYFHQGQRGR